MMIICLDYQIVECLHNVFKLPLDHHDRYRLSLARASSYFDHYHTFSTCCAHFKGQCSLFPNCGKCSRGVEGSVVTLLPSLIAARLRRSWARLTSCVTAFTFTIT